MLGQHYWPLTYHALNPEADMNVTVEDVTEILQRHLATLLEVSPLRESYPWTFEAGPGSSSHNSPQGRRMF